MLHPALKTALVVAALAGLPWLRSSSTAPRSSGPDAPTKAAAAPPAPALDRVVLLPINAPEYTALAIPKSYKSSPGAPLHLLVFRGGLCIRDRGIVQAHETGDGGATSRVVMEESGVTERAAVASDATAAVVASTRYVSRVDLTPGNNSAANDTVRSTTTLTLIDPSHADGRWRVTIENGRWVNELVALPQGAGVAVTTFLPRTGPTDLRILDAAGRESVHVSEAIGPTLHVEAAPGGGFVAAEIALASDAAPFERTITVFDLARETQWTYGWKYGSDDEPLSWSLGEGGVLAVKLGSGTRRFDPTGRRL